MSNPEKQKRIVINSEEGEKRIAFLDEEGTLNGFLIERDENTGVVGNVYKGVVKNILSGIEAAFVDIGLGKNGFLHFSDIEMSENDVDTMDGDDEDRDRGEREDSDEDADGEEGGQRPPQHHGRDGRGDHHGRGGRDGRGRDGRRASGHAAPAVKVGDEILVQVVKDQIGEKGVRLTAQVSLPGRFVVFLPGANLRGISKRITGQAEREHLRGILKELTLPKNSGVIVRTVSKGGTREIIDQEIRFLYKIWRTIKISQIRAKAPVCLYQNLPVVLQVIRDSLTEDVGEVIVDNPEEYKTILKFIGASFPSFKDRIKLYRDRMPIFSHYKLGGEIEKALQRKLWLKGGGYIIFDRTEALVAIDVNSGRSGGRNNPEETIVRTNIEAAKEIARQLQIRNMGGLIIIDFIDMRRAENKKKVLQVLQTALAQDRAKIKIYPISRLGLVEMTRQRVKESIGSEIYERCTHCDGLGLVKSIRSVWLDMLRDLKEIATASGEKRLRAVISNKMLNAEILERMHVLKKLEKDYRVRVALEPTDEIAPTGYEIYSMTTGNKLR